MACIADALLLHSSTTLRNDALWSRAALGLLQQQLGQAQRGLFGKVVSA